MRHRRAALALLVLAALVAGCTRHGPLRPPTAAGATTSTSLPGTTTSTTARPAAVLPASWPTSPRHTAPTDPAAQLDALRLSNQRGFDQVVFQFRGRVPGYDIRYTPRVIADPSGQPVPLAGRAFLQVVFQHATAEGHPVPAALAPRLATLQQLSPAGDFEHVLSFGLGLDHMAGFRVLALANPSRLVIELAAPVGAFPGDVRTVAQAREVQRAVDAGHQPWRLRAIQVAATYVAAGLGWANATVQEVNARTFRATAPGIRASATVDLAQPVGLGTGAIWVVSGVLLSA